MIKVIFFDIDNTIFPHKTFQVPQSTRKGLEQLRKNGIKCVICTGRHVLEFENIPINDIDFDGYLTSNGQIYLNSNRQYEWGFPYQGSEKQAVIDLFNNKEYPVAIVEADKIYINFNDDDVIRAQKEIGSIIFPEGQYTGNDIFQGVIFAGKDVEKNIKKQIGTLTFTRWHDKGMDLLAKGVSKASGIKEYLERNNISIEESMAIGDGDNDIEMLQYCGIGVAMGNSDDKVKQSADYVTDDILEDGLYKALVHFNLIEDK